MDLKKDKINKSFILLILNCEKYRYKAEKQNNTWLKALKECKDIDYFHIIGSKEICKKSKPYEFDNENRILYTYTKDDYLSLPDKIITAINAINNTYHYKYIFKTDDDQDLTKPQFFNHIMQLLSINSENYHYGGFKISVQDHYSTYYMIHNELPKKLFLKETEYCNGRFYLLSKEAVENLLKKKEDISKHIIEDHAIGLYLDDIYKIKYLNLKTRNYFVDMES